MRRQPRSHRPLISAASLTAYVQTRVRLVRFLNSAVHLSGEPPTTKRYISLEDIEAMLTREELQARIDELLPDGLSDEEIELVGMVDTAKKSGPLDPFQSDEDD